MEAWRLKLRQRLLGESVQSIGPKLTKSPGQYFWKTSAPKVEAKSVPQQIVEQVKLEEKIEKTVAQSAPQKKYVIL